MILRPVRPAVAHGSADDEAAGRVDVDLGVLGELDPLGSEHGLDDLLGHVAAQRASLSMSSACCVDTTTFSTFTWAAVDVAHRDLRLAVGTQVGQRTVLAHLRQTLAHALRQVNRHRHEGLRLVAGIAEHHALIARAHRLVDVVPPRRAAPRTTRRRPARCRATARGWRSERRRSCHRSRTSRDRSQSRR